jgi:hydroxymethylglutaryl-CoA reductase
MSFQGFSKLNRVEKLERLVGEGLLSAKDLEALSQPSMIDDFAEGWIENVIGTYSLPLGVAVNLDVDGVKRTLPMVVEESSIVAALSKTARWVSQNGSLETGVKGSTALGQIQIAKVKDLRNLKKVIGEHQISLVDFANSKIPSMVERGGGCRSLALRTLDRPDGGTMAVVHVEVDCGEAMGANTINQVCEALKFKLQELTGERVAMAILTNLVDTKIFWARARIRGVPQETRTRIVEASLFAELDPYRAATNNKGVMNGIDPVVLATGNDWRAVEAGLHAYASRSGRYTSLTQWKEEGEFLIGEIEGPCPLGVVGGVTTLHPMAKMALKIMKVETSSELSRLVMAAGLLQNLGALRALTGPGIVKGHMKLHAKNIVQSLSTSDAEAQELLEVLYRLVEGGEKISESVAARFLEEIREGRSK